MVLGKYSGGSWSRHAKSHGNRWELSQPPPAAGILHRFNGEPLASSHSGYLPLHITFVIQKYICFSKNGHVSCPGNHSH